MPKRPGPPPRSPPRRDRDAPWSRGSDRPKNPTKGPPKKPGKRVSFEDDPRARPGRDPRDRKRDVPRDRHGAPIRADHPPKRSPGRPPMAAPMGPPPVRRDPRAHSHGRAIDTERLVVGKHAVEAVLRHQRQRAERLYLQQGTGALDLAEIARDVGVQVALVESAEIDALAGAELAHQGAVLQCAPYPYADLDDFQEAPALTLVLDGVEDPRNLGAAARAAYALGADLLLVPEDRAASCTASAHKVAAGALSRIRVARAKNLKRDLEKLKEKGAWLVGAEADAKARPWEVDLKGKIALVVGGEDRGLRRLTREACDHVVSIPMPAKDMSLNAADAATVLLYEVLRQRS